jgi:hypothetical protein
MSTHVRTTVTNAETGTIITGYRVDPDDGYVVVIPDEEHSELGVMLLRPEEIAEEIADA